MEAAVHIGTTKTGSSTIQQFLIENEPVLQDIGIYLPRFGSSQMHTSVHRPLMRWAIRGEAAPNFGVLRAPASARAMLISHESLCNISSEEQMERIASVLPSTSRIICYYREPSRHVISRYKQGIKARRWRSGTSLDRFIRQQTDALQKGGGYYRFDEKANLWQTRFPDYRAVPYQPAPSESFVRSFMANCGLPLEESASLEFPVSQNVSPSDSSTFLLFQLIAAAKAGKLEADELQRLQLSVCQTDGCYAAAVAGYLEAGSVDMSEFVEAFAEMNPITSKLLSVPSTSLRETTFPVRSHLTPAQALELARSVYSSIEGHASTGPAV